MLAYLGKFDGNNAPEVRRLLAPLQMMASETNVAEIMGNAPEQEQREWSAHGARGGLAPLSQCLGRRGWLRKTRKTQTASAAYWRPKNNLGDDATGFAFQVEGAVVGAGIETSRVVFSPMRLPLPPPSCCRDRARPTRNAAPAPRLKTSLRTFSKAGR